ncbi:MAG: prolyl oligopeptidase family serine peptidase [Myxococcales bacterium]|nr:prolyl oligopeptidase family serine peptidase [Myxococcales bacterium]
MSWSTLEHRETSTRERRIRRFGASFALGLALLLPVSGALPGCSSDDTTERAQTEDGLPQGQFLMGVSLAPLSGLVLPYRVDISDAHVELRAIANDGTVSDLLAQADGVVPAEDGTFSIDFGGFTMPGAYTPTKSDVDVELVVNGKLQGNDAFCGDITGKIVTFDLDLAGSTFGAVTYSADAEAPTSCDGAAAEIPRIDQCPTVSEGNNTGFPSGDEPREFELVLPSTYDAGKSYPLVFVYHGFGGKPTDMLDGVGFRARADEDDVILAAPKGLESGNGAAWNIATAAPQNVDVALFDDMLKCISESFSVDDQRIYVTGMSNGGLMTGTLIATRSDVIAAAAPFSGGISLPYVKTDNQPPVLASYGGPTDMAFQQDFEKLANDMVSELKTEGHFVVLCNHNQGHHIEASYLPWAMRFLTDHKLGSAPAYSDSLPSVFPDYCSIQ